MKVSVVIPIYQSAKYLGETLESLENQTYFKKNPANLEVQIIVDGECEAFEHRIPSSLTSNIKIHKIPHCGVSGARNYGIEKSHSDFVAFLDADDTWLPEKLEKQVELLHKNFNAGMAYTNSFWIGKTGRVLSRTQKQQYGRLPQGNIAYDMMERDYIITSSVLIRREVFGKAGLFDTSLEVCEDWEFKIRIAKAYEVLCLDEPLIRYRLHAGGTHYKCQRMLECGYAVFDRHAKDFPGGLPPQFKANVPLNLAGSWLYIDQPAEARKYLNESRKIHGSGNRMALMFILSFMPKPARDLLLWLRDKIPFLP